MADVMLNLIDPLEARYSWGDATQEAIVLRKRDMVEAFRNHTIDDLKEAVRQVVNTRRYSTMPSVADVKINLDAIAAKRMDDAAPKKSIQGYFATYDDWKKQNDFERTAAQDWARKWLQQTYLGREALDEGWARPLYGLIWQIKLNRSRNGKACDYDDILLDDIATQTEYGEKLIKYLKANCRAYDLELERKLVLKERFA